MWGRMLCALGWHRWVPLTVWMFHRKQLHATALDQCTRCGRTR